MNDKSTHHDFQNLPIVARYDDGERIPMPMPMPMGEDGAVWKRCRIVRVGVAAPLPPPRSCPCCCCCFRCCDEGELAPLPGALGGALPPAAVGPRRPSARLLGGARPPAWALLPLLLLRGERDASRSEKLLARLNTRGLLPLGCGAGAVAAAAVGVDADDEVVAAESSRGIWMRGGRPPPREGEDDDAMVVLEEAYVRCRRNRFERGCGTPTCVSLFGGSNARRIDPLLARFFSPEWLCIEKGGKGIQSSDGEIGSSGSTQG